MQKRFLFSFVVDDHPKFAYQGWHLARSILTHCRCPPEDIHVHFAEHVHEAIQNAFRVEGYTLYTFKPFGDGRWCNKAVQLPMMLDLDFDIVILLDTDTILVDDVRPFLQSTAVQAKIVDLPNPSLEVLDEMFQMAGVETNPDLIVTDASDDLTFNGNANGGFYAIPRYLAPRFSAAWRHWIEWLIANDGPLVMANMEMHVDQIAACLALNHSSIPFAAVPSNVNYFVHMAAPHRHFDTEQSIAMLHYHESSLDVLGLISPPRLTPLEENAVKRANDQIGSGFNNLIFWSYRYACFPERGSGVGSRNENLKYKRMLLREHGIEEAESILDIGCGDLEVLRDLVLGKYLGVDVSPAAVEKARLAKPEWTFEVYEKQKLDMYDFVLCFEVLIHQTSRGAYEALIDLMAASTNKTLIVSGYDARENLNHMIFYHEPLSCSLAKTGKFRSIQLVGAHSDVKIYRCDV